jgi:hypothetical protein
MTRVSFLEVLTGLTLIFGQKLDGCTIFVLRYKRGTIYDTK